MKLEQKFVFFQNLKAQGNPHDKWFELSLSRDFF